MAIQESGSDDPEDKQPDEQQDEWIEMVAEEPPTPSLLQHVSSVTKTPLFGVPITKLSAEAQNGNNDETNRAETPVAIITNAGRRITNLNRPLFDAPERQDPEMKETFETLDRLIRKNATGREIHDGISTLMLKTDTEKAGTIWALALLYLQDVVEQTFAGLESRLKENCSEQEKISALQYCWQRILSNEGKLFVLENVRALIQKSDKEEKNKLFWGLVISIINSLKIDDEEPSIEIPANIRARFLHAEIAERVPATKLLNIDESYSQIRKQLESSLLSSPRNDRVALFKLDELLRINPFLDLEEIMDHTNVEDYIKMCEQLYQSSLKEIEAISEDRDDAGTIILSDSTVELYERAWNEVIFPRLLIWEEILYSDLLLPKDEAAA